MIYVRRDSNLIPEQLLKAAAKAQAELEKIGDKAERTKYINKKARLWRRFARYLKAMSYGKCWYSESDCVQSFADVDHYRPKNAARRDDTVTDDGYPWLAFSWENFCYAAQRCNQLNTHEESDETVGKGAWFPLMPESPVASWDNRCVKDERPLLLDPTIKHDVRLIKVDADGLIRHSDLCVGDYERRRVNGSVKYLGLNLDDLVGARKRVMEAVQEQVRQMLKVQSAADQAKDGGQQFAEHTPIDDQIKILQKLSHPSSPYAAAARAQLCASGFAMLCTAIEELA